MTYKEAFYQGCKVAEKYNKDTEEIKYLLLESSEMDYSDFYYNYNSAADEKIINQFLIAVDKYCIDNIPIQHLLGYSYFFGNKFIVNEHTLIPRRETEELVEHILYFYDKYFHNKRVRILDLGTGSGCIAITLAKEIKKSFVVATDISKDALMVAKKNSEIANEKVTFIESDWFSNVTGLFDIIVANPPYIPNQEEVDLIVSKDPSLALYGGKEGIDHYQTILKDIHKYLKTNGLIAFEHGSMQKDKIAGLIYDNLEGLIIKQYKDLSGNDRMTFASKCLKNESFILAFPTDTVYGVACRPYDYKGINKINEIKERPTGQKMAVLCSSLEMIRAVAVLNKKQQKIIEHFMPGPLTIIVKASRLYEKMTGDNTVGVRIPDHSLALSIIEKYGPLKTTSINKHNEPPENEYEKIYELYRDEFDIIFKGEIYSSVSSTVIDFTNEDFVIIREGKITKEDILKIL